MATIAESRHENEPRPDRLSGTPRAHALDRWIYVVTAVFFIAIVLAGFIPSSLAKIAAVQAGLKSAFDVKFVFNKWTLGEDFCKEALGFTDEQLHSTVHGSADDPCWDADQSAVFRLSDELHETGTLSDELWESLAARFDEAQILELIATAGWYHLIGYICNGARIDLEDWAARFPAR